ncbi:MAG: hypothetical protein Q8L09_05050 [Candidatus Moranbacteria bacterium]|nr:hypothetical protein [Candidatus Moranbacteria bacterium]
MDLKNTNLKKVGRLQSSNLKIAKWLGKRLVIGKYSYSVKNLFLAGLVVFFIASVVVYSLFIYGNNQSDPNAAIEKEIKSLTASIGKFMELPVGEQPNLATVTDQAKLKGQNFFANAQNGDKLLVYPKAKKAILFRPSTGKIIEATNLTSDSHSAPEVSPEINP